jgi:hypothetical protein
MDTIDIMQGEVTVRTQDRSQPVIVEFPDGQRVEVNIHRAGDGYPASVVVHCEPGQAVAVRGVDHDFVVLAPIVNGAVIEATVRFDADVRLRYENKS